MSENTKASDESAEDPTTKKEDDESTAKPTESKKVELPADATEDERKDFEATGTLELYELRREAEKAAKEKAKLRAEAAERAEVEAQKKALREQIAAAKAAEKETEKPVLPADATEEERRDFERTGSLELYDLHREADKIQRERIKMRQEAAERATMEEHKRALRAQAEMDRLTLENERKALAAPPRKDPFEDSKPIPGSERLPEPVKGVLRRLFGYASSEWTEANQIGLVNFLLAIGNHKAMAWAHEMRDALAADVYHSHDLSPRAILKGSTGLKAIAGPAFAGEFKALSGGDERLKALADGRPRRKKKKRRDGIVEVEATRVREERQERRNNEEDSDEEVVDDAPNQDAENVHDPWGEFD